MFFRGVGGRRGLDTVLGLGSGGFGGERLRFNYGTIAGFRLLGSCGVRGSM